jgi:hypothetical protein
MDKTTPSLCHPLSLSMQLGGHTFERQNLTLRMQQLRADLDQLFFQARQRPAFDRLRCRQRAQEIGEIISQRMKLEANGVGELKGGMVALSARLTSIDQRLAVVHTDLALLSERMDYLEARMDGIEGRLEWVHALI